MTIAEMRALLGLGEEVSDAAVVEAYAASLGVADDGDVTLIELALAKKHLRLSPADTSEDDLIAIYLAAAIATLDGKDGWLGRALVERTYIETLDASNGAIRLPYPPIVSVASVETQDIAGAWTALDPTAWQLDGRTLTVSDTFAPVRVTYRAGYNPAASRPLPPPIVQAVLLMLENAYQHRGETSPASVGRVPVTTTVSNLLATFRVFS